MKVFNITLKNLLLVLSVVPMSAFCLDPKLHEIREREQRAARAVEQIREVAVQETELRILRAAHQIVRQQTEIMYPNLPISDDAIDLAINQLLPEMRTPLFERAATVALATARQEELQDHHRQQERAEQERSQQARRNSRLHHRTESSDHGNDHKRHRGQ